MSVSLLSFDGYPYGAFGKKRMNGAMRTLYPSPWSNSASCESIFRHLVQRCASRSS